MPHSFPQPTIPPHCFPPFHKTSFLIFLSLLCNSFIYCNPPPRNCFIYIVGQVNHIPKKGNEIKDLTYVGFVLNSCVLIQKYKHIKKCNFTLYVLEFTDPIKIMCPQDLAEAIYVTRLNTQKVATHEVSYYLLYAAPGQRYIINRASKMHKM